MKLRQKSVATLGALSVLSLAIIAISPGTAVAKDGHPGTTADEALVLQARRLNPLRAIANAVGEQGRGSASGIFSNIGIDQNNNRVNVFVTDIPAGKKMLDSAKKSNPEIDLSKAILVYAPYTKKAMDAAIDKIMASTQPKTAADLTVYSAAAAPDGTGVHVTAKVSAANVAMRAPAVSTLESSLRSLDGSGIPVTVTAGNPGDVTSWRWNDSIPFIAGDVLVGTSHQSGYVSQCTAGIAAQKNGEDYILASAHCFRQGSLVYGEGDAIGNFGFHTGNYVGKVTYLNDHWDAAAIDTGYKNGNGSNSDEADTPKNVWYPVNDGFAYSYNGDSVCQDGARSYYDGHGVPCSIIVSNSDITWSVTWDDGTVHSLRGVEGSKSGWAVERGDSGALVFAVKGNNLRESRGLQSWGTNDHSTIRWTETKDILNAFGMTMNPHV